jgi:hypothetical protein
VKLHFAGVVPGFALIRVPGQAFSVPRACTADPADAALF